MRNAYLKNLSKIEFAVTDACSGRCKHCSEGSHNECGAQIDPKIAADAVEKISKHYDVKTVLAFGGEPLLHIEAVCSIISAAKKMNIPKRQIITNGYFEKDSVKIRNVVKELAGCGVNDLLLSVDAFHQETIPLEVVRIFAEEARKCGIPMRLQPAWLVSRADNNPYNLKTKEILESLSDLQIVISEGNVIFPEGNAKIYLADYFKNDTPQNPYTEDPCDVKCISFSPNGDVLESNVYQTDILDIVNNYLPSFKKNDT